MLGRIFNRTLEVGGAQETVAQVGWDPNDPFAAIWAPCWRIVADPAAPGALALAAFTGPVGSGRQPALRRPSAALGRRGDAGDDGRGALAAIWLLEP